MDGDAAAVVASYQFNDNVGLTALWMRPLNDNDTGTNAEDEPYGNGYNNYLDNMDLFALMLPLKFDGVELTPWAMYGMQGKNTRFNEGGVETADGALDVTLPGYLPGMNAGALVAARANGTAAQDAMRLATRASALATTRVGAQQSIPTLAEANSLE